MILDTSAVIAILRDEPEAIPPIYFVRPLFASRHALCNPMTGEETASLYLQSDHRSDSRAGAERAEERAVPQGISIKASCTAARST